MKRALMMITVVVSVILAGALPLRSADGGVPGSATGNPRPGLPQGFGAQLDIGYCYDYLAPFGTWISLDPYGYVWCPRHMGYRWRPYADGYWIWTDYGWTWVSDYDWGWMPFHYGRWGWDNDCGWFWVPGSVWGPAWVTWRWSDLYMGWAPIPPGFDFRAGIDFDVMAMGIPFDSWVFVGGSHFLDRDIHRYVLPFERNPTIVRGTTIRNNFEFRGDRLVNQGIDVETVRRMTRHDVLRYTLADSNRPGAAQVAGREARFYRPSIREVPGARPKQFLSRDEAQRELAPAKIFEPQRQAPAAASPEATLRQRQADEQSLLKQSQAQELKDMERRRREEVQKMAGAAEKAQSQQDYQARVAEQRRQHQAEQQRMNERHRQEAEQVRQSGQSRQQAPPPPRKK